MGTSSIAYEILAGQTKASVFYSNRTEAFIELISPTAVSVQVIEDSVLKQGGDVPGFTLETRVANLRIPAGHWLVVTRDASEQPLQLRVRRLTDPSVQLAPAELIVDAAFSVSGEQALGLVTNGLNKPMTYRLVVRIAAFEPTSDCYVQSGSDAIHPLPGSFILDTVVPTGGTLEIRPNGGLTTGNFDLFGDN